MHGRLKHIDKSKRPVFSTNEELEQYRTDSEIRSVQERKKREAWEEECRLKRMEAYKHEPTEIEILGGDDWASPRYKDDGKTLEKLNIVFGYNKKFTIPEGVEIIDNFAFHYADELTCVVLPSTLKTIREFAFCHTGIREIVIPEGVEVLESSVFQECEHLERVRLPDSIKEIQNFVFSKCSSLIEVNIPPNAIIEWSVFPLHLKDLEKYEMPWEEMRVYEEWKKTHPNILQWKNVREGIMEVEYKRIAEQKAKGEAERQERLRKRKREMLERRRLSKKFHFKFPPFSECFIYIVIFIPFVIIIMVLGIAKLFHREDVILKLLKIEK